MEQTQSTQNLLCCKCNLLQTSKQETKNGLSYVENYPVGSQRKQTQEHVICLECQQNQLAEQNIQPLDKKQEGATTITNIKINEQGEKVWNEKTNRI